MDDRVRSRLAHGLVVEMGSRDESLRLDILKSRVALARTLHPDFDVPAPVLGFIAKTVTHNVRDLDGTLNGLLASKKLTGRSVTMEMAEAAVRDLVRPLDPPASLHASLMARLDRLGPAKEVAQIGAAIGREFWELWAAVDMARLWRGQGKRTEARDLLAPL